MRGLNKVMLIGHLGKDPEMPNLSNPDAKMAKFPMATSESYKDKNGQIVEQTEWHNIVIWRSGLADIASRYLRKGSLVFVEGKIRTRSYEKEGQKHYMTEVVADNFQMLDKKGENDGGASSNDYSQAQAGGDSSDGEGDDLPF